MFIPNNDYTGGSARSFSGFACGGLALAVAAASTLVGQEEETDVFELSPFEVTTTEEAGYSASESITGSRIRSKIAELPFAVNVMTNEFMEDFAADSLDDQFGYVSSFAGDEVEGWYQLRGFKQQNQLRNGFRRLGLIDRVTVSRAEVIKGPAAGTYGAINPGGIINIVTKMPTEEKQQEVSIEVGTDEYYRTAFSSSGPIGEEDKLLYRFDTAWLTRDDFAFTGREQFTASGVLEWRMSEKSKLIYETEYLKRDQARGRGLLYVRDEESREYTRLATELFDFSFLGPDEFNFRDISTQDLRFEHKFDETFSLRMGYNYFDRFYDQFTGYPSRVEIDVDGSHTADGQPEDVIADGVVPFIEPVSYQIWQEGESFQADLLKEIDGENISHRLLFTFDTTSQTNQRYRTRLNRGVTSDEAAQIESTYGIDLARNDLRRHPFFNAGFENSDYPDQDYSSSLNYRSFTISDPDYSWIDPQTLELLKTPVVSLADLDSTETVDVTGFFLADQIRALDNKLLINIGTRYDEVKTTAVTGPTGSSSANFGGGGSNSDSASVQTYQAGVNYRLNEGLLVYSNYSTSFLPINSTNDTNPITGEPLSVLEIFDNEEGKGFEVGLKGDSMGGKLNFTLNYFAIDREGVVISVSKPYPDVPDESFTYKAQNGLESATGYEFDFNYSPNKAFNIMGGIGFVDSTIDVSDNASIVGLPVAEIPDYNASVAMKHTIREGGFKGFFWNAGLRFVGDSRITNSSGRSHLYQDGYELLEGGFGFRWGNDVKHTVQFIGKNILDEKYTRAGAKRGDRQRFILRYRARL